MMNEMEEKKLNMNELARTAGGFDDPYFDDFPTDAITDELVSFHYDSYRPGSHARLDGYCLSSRSFFVRLTFKEAHLCP